MHAGWALHGSTGVVGHSRNACLMPRHVPKHVWSLHANVSRPGKMLLTDLIGCSFALESLATAACVCVAVDRVCTRRTPALRHSRDLQADAIFKQFEEGSYANVCPNLAQTGMFDTPTQGSSKPFVCIQSVVGNLLMYSPTTWWQGCL